MDKRMEGEIDAQGERGMAQRRMDGEMAGGKGGWMTLKAVQTHMEDLSQATKPLS